MTHDPLFALAQQAMSKAAAINTGGMQVRQTAFGNFGGGMTDPDPSMAFNSQLGDARSQANLHNFVDEQATGTNLRPYQGEINEKDQVMAYAVNPQTSQGMNQPSMPPVPQPKMASNDEAEYTFQKWASESGLFQQFVPDSAIYSELVKIASMDAETDTELAIANMIGNGYIQQLPNGNQILPHLLG